MEHIVKTQAPFYDPTASNIKPFELRCDDRAPPYSVGDTLLMLRYDGDNPTGEQMSKLITYVYRGEYCKEGYCAMAIAPLTAEKDEQPLELFFGRGELGIDTVAKSEDSPLREILVRRLPFSVLPVGSVLGDKGKTVDELENILVRMYFECAESALVLERAIHTVLESFGKTHCKSLSCAGCSYERAHTLEPCYSCRRNPRRLAQYEDMYTPK